MLRVLATALLVGVAGANQYNVLYPHYIAPAECAHGCAKWADVAGDGVKLNQSKVAALFANGTVPADAGASCLWPGMAVSHHEGRRRLADGKPKGKPTESSIPYCLCQSAPGSLTPPANETGQCTPPMSTPEQINLQYASADIVVAAFVTYEKGELSAPPQAMFGEEGKPTSVKQIKGISHYYSKTSLDPSSNTTITRHYTMSFVKFDGLKPGQRYSYKVKSGAAAAAWSATFTFRSARAAPATRLGIYGDMGVSPYNNMQNLLTDCQAGKIDVVAHMGDHCYDMQMEDDRKGDAYMNAMQPLVATCPWIPIIGNHESADAKRWDNQTWGEVYANPLEQEYLKGSGSTATSALGHVLTKGTMLGAGLHGTTPSGRSDYFSVDLGLIHIAALSTISPDAAELAWLEKDLTSANANRDKVPWVLVTSHYQIYLSSSYAQGQKDRSSAAYYHGDGGEFSADPRDAFKTCSANGEAADCATVGDFLAEAAGKLDPVLQKYGVDIYDAGHAHEYGVTWPMSMGQAMQQNYSNPMGTVYITEGNGGVPGVTSTHKFNKPSADWARIHGDGGAYGRISLANESVLVYEHVWNNGNNGTGKVMETWAVERSSTYKHPASWGLPVESGWDCASPTATGVCTKAVGYLHVGAFKDEASCIAAAACRGGWNCAKPKSKRSPNCAHFNGTAGKFKDLKSCEKSFPVGTPCPKP